MLRSMSERKEGKKMTIEEAAKLLRKMYDEAPSGEKATSIHLFGIRYAREIDSMSPKELVERADLRPSYRTEIRKMVKLAKYVKER